MKKTISLLSVLLSFSIIFTSCSAGKIPSATTESVLTTSSEASNEKVYRVAINQFAQHGSLDNCREGFIKGLETEIGKENLVIDVQNATADGALNAQISKSFAEKKYDLLCGIATPAAEALYNAAEPLGIPVIYTAVSDPVNAGFSNDDGLGKGITGTSDVLPVGKQLDLIRKILPNAKKIGILYTTNEKNSELQVKSLKEAAPEKGFEIVAMGISNKSEIPQALDQLLPKVDCINNTLDNTVVQALGLIIAKAEEAKVPVFGSEIEQVKLGCIASEGIDYIKLGEQTGKMAAKVLKGEDINSIKFEVINETETYINKKSMETYGLTLPSDLQNVVFVE